MYEDLLGAVEKKLRKDGATPSYESILEATTNALIDQTRANEQSDVEEIVTGNDGFIERNRDRWKNGFSKLHILHRTCLLAGMEFQKQFLRHEKYKTDVLFGVLMRQHAHACRIAGEIIHLLEGGYADGAAARWRTLYEISVTCLIISKYGRDAAADYIRHGVVKNFEGMAEYQKTATAMSLKPFSDEEIEEAKKQREEITQGEGSWHWARKYTGASKLEKLREIVGLDHWSHNYKLASRNIHADYYEMSTLYGMSEAAEDMLLVGPSNSGLTSPAHFTAISLSQITCTFILLEHENDTCELSFIDSMLFAKLINHYVDQVGQGFLSVNGDGEDRFQSASS